jgi:hypothetical protein
MSTNINPNYNPATEATNQLFNTLIPVLSDDADIQEALRLYHYGNATSLPSNNSAIIANSVAGHLKSLRDDVTALEDLGLGSEVSETEPSNPQNGYIWLKEDSSASQLLGTVAIYQNSTPTGTFVDGQLWVDKNSSPLTMYVYDAATTTWRAIGS